MFFAPKGEIFNKIVSSMQEIKARKGPVIAITTEGAELPEVQRLGIGAASGALQGTEGACIQILGRLTQAVGSGICPGSQGRPEAVDGSERPKVLKPHSDPHAKAARCQHKHCDPPPAKPGRDTLRRPLRRRRDGHRRLLQRSQRRLRLNRAVRSNAVRRTKHRNIGADRQLNHQLAGMSQVVVVLHQPLAHLAGSNPNHRIGVGIVGGRAPKDLNPNAPLLQFGGIPLQRLLHRMGQQYGVPLAIGEKRMSHQPVQLLTDRSRVEGSSRRLNLGYGFRSHGHFLLPMSIHPLPKFNFLRFSCARGL